MKDKYDLAVEYLTANPQEIKKAWDTPSSHEAGCLFRAIYPQSTIRERAFTSCGCLTQIRRDDYNFYAYDRERGIDQGLTGIIRNDNRIPSDPQKITTAHLPVFAEWQRRIDKYYETGILEREEKSAPKLEPEYRTVTIDTKVKELTETKLQLS